MTKTGEIYKGLFDDLIMNQHSLKNNLYRKLTCANGVGLIYSISVNSKLRAINIPVNSEMNYQSFPAWKGISISIVTLQDYSSNNQNYIELKQSIETESDIFEIVVEDIRKGLDEVSNPENVTNTTQKILKKWKDFFSSGKSPILDSKREQGLFGELLFLKDMIQFSGSLIVKCWAGSNKETHDFYISDNAVEVKTSVLQAPYMAHINSEYQLDDNDIAGKLFLKMYALRRSQSDGQKLPELIFENRCLLSDDFEMLSQFNDKLLEAGYLDAASDYYINGFTLRDDLSFEVKEGFPRIVKNNMMKGVYDLEYKISISECSDFLINNEKLKGVIKG